MANNKYQKLQDICTKMVEDNSLWFQIYWYNVEKLQCDEVWFYIFREWIWTFYKSYNEVFAKDSWFMDFLKRETDWKSIMINPEIIKDDEWLTWVDSEWWYGDCDVEYHYMIMWPMTSEQKIDYILENIAL
jgi:hypothetical protein